MKKNKKPKKRKSEEENGRPEDRGAWYSDIHPDVKKSAAAILFFIATALFVLSFIGEGGRAGAALYRVLSFLLGRGYFFAPLTVFFVGVSYLFSERPRIIGTSLAGGVLFLLTNLAILHILFSEGTGGLLGSILASPLLSFFDFWASMTILAGFLAVSVLLMFNVPFWKKGAREDILEESPQEQNTKEGMLDFIQAAVKNALAEKKEEDCAAPAPPPASQETQPLSAHAHSPQIGGADALSLSLRRVAKKFDYEKPSLELLQGDRGMPSSGDIRANANIIKRTLENFGIPVDMDEVSIGPTVTQYTLKPAEGVKLARIVALHNDLSLALAAHPIRIEAPIPGKSLVGIEVPNKSIALVGLRMLLEQKAFQESASPLLFALGRDVAGFPVFADLAKMPHLLVSGATGAGKSVAIHSMIASFLYRNPPQVLRFIIVDPKRVELSMYNDVPHLLTPVITDSKTTVQALRWATKEMDRRYDILSLHQTRDIMSYNGFAAKASEQEFMPYIVIIIDELADLMATFPREVESSIIRLAQMARAVGIHLVVATQRPSVEVITGLIKANITSRIALQVASQIDSRTILDAAGAEKLLGNGDMLFLAGDTARPRRIQGAYVSEQEIKRLVDFLREQAEPEYDEEIVDGRPEERKKEGENSSAEDDPLYSDARDLIMQTQKASASYLQRRFRIGYARAARLLDLLEADGVIGPQDGAKPRDILIKTADVSSGTFHENDKE